MASECLEKSGIMIVEQVPGLLGLRQPADAKVPL